MPSFKTAALIATAATVWSSSASAAGLYAKNSAVLEIDAKNYDSLIAKSNYTSIVEFYAPWCGHCRNLAPHFTKAADNLSGIAKVAAINCDEESNKPFCGRMGVQGFPTLKIVRPSKDAKRVGKPIVEDYRGERNAKAIVDAVVGAMQNHVRRMTDKDLDGWLKEQEGIKAILFSEKGTTASMTKALAIDFLGGIAFAQAKSTEEKLVERFGVTKFPTLVVLPGGDAEPVLYDGEIKKAAISKFLTRFATPNPDAHGKPAQAAPKKQSSSSSSKKASSSSAASESASPSSSSSSSAPPPPPPPPPPAIQITPLSKPEELQSACLTSKSSTCILLLESDTIPSEANEDSPEQKEQNTSSPSKSTLEAIAARRGKTFPFYYIPRTNDARDILLKALGIENTSGEFLLAVNGKKGWWRRFEADGQVIDAAKAGRWIDDIRMGEGKKEKLPGGVVRDLEKEEVVVEGGVEGEKVTDGDVGGKAEEEVKGKMDEGDGDAAEKIKIELEEVVELDEPSVGEKERKEEKEGEKGWVHEEL